MIMESKNLLIFTGFLAALLISFSPGVLATSYVELSVFPNQIQACPCSAMTPQTVAVTVKNLHHDTDTIRFTLDVPDGWNSQIQSSVTLASGEEQTLSLFLINVNCGVAPGTYTATVTAESLSRGETVSKELTIDVLLCRGAELTVDQQTKDSCVEEPSDVRYNMTIKNLGKFIETFDLTASVGWTSFSQSQVTLEAGESRNFGTILDPRDVLPGLHEITVYAKSTDPNSPNYYNPATILIKLDVKECYDFNFSDTIYCQRGQNKLYRSVSCSC